jgi:hypothetical protein
MRPASPPCLAALAGEGGLALSMLGRSALHGAYSPNDWWLDGVTSATSRAPLSLVLSPGGARGRPCWPEAGWHRTYRQAAAIVLATPAPRTRATYRLQLAVGGCSTSTGPVHARTHARTHLSSIWTAARSSA